MTCARYREALSARLDGEDPGLEESALVAHLDRCAPCRGWLEAATRVTRRARLGNAPDVPDLSDDIASAVAADAPRPRRVELAQAGLAAVAVAQLVLAVPAMVGLTHASHESGAWEVALAVGLLAVAARPERAPSLLPVVLAAAGVILPLAGWDVAAGRTTAPSEAGHLLLLAASGLLVSLRRWAGTPHDGGTAYGTRPGREEGRAA